MNLKSRNTNISYKDNRNNKNRLKFYFILLSLLIPGISSTVVIASEKLVFTSVEGAYVQQVSETVLKSAYAKLGIKFETSWLPAKRALLMASSGQSDGEISRIGVVAKKYPNLIQIKIPINQINGVAFTKHKPIQINGWESLRPYKIGINRGVIFSVMGTRGMNVTYVNSFSSLFKMLDKDRVDVIVCPWSTGLFLMRKYNLKDIIINEPSLTRLNLYHYLNKRHAKLARRLEVVLQKMQESGEIAYIRSRYINDLKRGIIHSGKPQQ